MATPISLIVGLGNPGAKYANTRHNLGFRFLDSILGDLGVGLRSESRFQAQVGEGQFEGRKIRILAPTTYMNESGMAVAGFIRYFDIPLEETLVIHDDLDLPAGAIRLKQGGGHGGHNGLRDIFSHLGSREFVRLRIGIGHPGNGNDVVNYVLKPATAAEQQEIDAALEAAHSELPRILRGEFDLARNVLHTLGPKSEIADETEPEN